MENNDLYNAIWKRRSVRKFLEKRIDQSKIDFLKRSISSINEISGLKMEFIEESDSLDTIKAFRFKNVHSVIAVKGKTSDPHLYEKCGYYGEHIVLEAVARGFGTCWVAAATLNEKKSSSLNIKDDETIVCVIPVGYGAEGVSRSTSVPETLHRRTKSVSDFLDGNKNVPEWVTSAMKAVQFAPTANNSQRARFHYAEETLSVQIPPGNLKKVDLGIIKLHFELAASGKFELGSPSVFKKN